MPQLEAMKEELLKARVSVELKKAVADVAAARGESEAVIIREALKQYVVGKSDAVEEKSLTPAVPPKGPVSYLKSKAKK